MNVVIVGCGRIGSALADQMYRRGHAVAVIDQSAQAFQNLPIDFRGRMIEGDALNRGVLQRADVEHAHALAAVTRSDTLNALVAHIARSQYHVERVVARNYDPRLQPIQDAFGIPVVGSANWRVQRILEILADGPLQNVLIDASADLAVFKVIVPTDWHGKSLAELHGNSAARVLSWSRGGQPLAFSETAPVEGGDLLYLSVPVKEVEDLQRRLGALSGTGV